MTNWRGERICQSCGKRFKARGDAKTCGSTCRSRLARAEAWATKRRDLAGELVDELVNRVKTVGAPADIDQLAAIERKCRDALLDLSMQGRLELAADASDRLSVGD